MDGLDPRILDIRWRSSGSIASAAKNFLRGAPTAPAAPQAAPAAASLSEIRDFGILQLVCFSCQGKFFAMLMLKSQISFGDRDVGEDKSKQGASLHS